MGGGPLLVEDGNTAQFTAIPFRLVFSKLGVDRFKERTHEGNLPCRADDGAFEVEVSHYEGGEREKSES